MGSFGDRLKKEREQRSISLDDIALSTKIGTRMLRALEEEKFDQLPGGIFNKGFVRAYARHVGLDEEQAISDYMAALGETQQRSVAPEIAVMPKPEGTHERRRDPVQDTAERERVADIPWGLLALALLLAALVFATWSYYHRSRREERGSATPNSSTEISPAVPVTAASGLQKGPLPRDGNKAASTPIPTTDQAAPQASTVAQAALHASAPLQEPAAGTFTVSLKGNDDSEECWVSIVVDGQPPVEATLSPPYEKVVQAKNEVVVKAGSIGALDIFFNGQKLGRLGEYGTVRTLTFHKDGLQPPAPKPVVPATARPQ